ncbi:MAG: cupin domain-containing protein [Deltaproteobacteria bacterium]|nr:cupin domain-containing protein [Deltaproteobacteria bacterium]MBW2306073.1 cupin domain-containing protein [Deltaproteobacteria bacterium]
MPKPEREFTDSTILPWSPVEMGVMEKVLAEDPETGDKTRLVRFPPGYEGREVKIHDYWEEIYVLDGYFEDITLDCKFPAGSYACRPPGMTHGPFRTPLGCTALEILYGNRNIAGGLHTR